MKLLPRLRKPLPRFLKARLRNLLLTFLALLLSFSSYAASPCERIISLAPSVTEVIFQLGLGSHVVGVSRFDEYPPSVKSLPKVGGYLDPSLEAIVHLHPTVVIGVKEATDTAQQLRKLGMQVLLVEHRDIAGILNSLTTVGEVCGIQEKAREERGTLETRNGAVIRRVGKEPLVRVLISLGSDGEERLENAYISGRDGFYSSVLRLAGAVNAYEGGTMPIPNVSMEGVKSLNPDAIIEILPVNRPQDQKERVIERWRSIIAVEDRSKRKIFVVDDSYASIPGPRYIELVEKIAHLLHPRVWESGHND